MCFDFVITFYCLHLIELNMSVLKIKLCTITCKLNKYEYVWLLVNIFISITSINFCVHNVCNCKYSSKK